MCANGTVHKSTTPVYINMAANMATATPATPVSALTGSADAPLLLLVLAVLEAAEEVPEAALLVVILDADELVAEAVPLVAAALVEAGAPEEAAAEICASSSAVKVPVMPDMLRTNELGLVCDVETAITYVYFDENARAG